MNELLKQMEDDTSSEKKSESGLDTMGKIGAVANNIADIDTEIEYLETQLKFKKEDKKHLSENVLPSLFAEVGLSELKLHDGRQLKVSNYYGASIKEDKKEAAFSWLRDKGYGDLIKNQVSCSFGRNEDNKAKNMISILEESGFSSSQREWVEPSTLRAFVKELHETGKDLPMDLLGAFIGQRTTIKK
tara:strand:+ start:3446 stop:4009 length:564 start_codon:yes stop_codon:yes gene_type:complete